MKLMRVLSVYCAIRAFCQRGNLRVYKQGCRFLLESFLVVIYTTHWKSRSFNFWTFDSKDKQDLEFFLKHNILSIKIYYLSKSIIILSNQPNLINQSDFIHAWIKQSSGS